MLLSHIDHRSVRSSVHLIDAIAETDGTRLHFDASFHYSEKELASSKPVKVLSLPSPIYIMDGWGVAVLPPEILRWNVQLRQEIQLGVMQHELAGWHVRHALAECVDELQVPTGTERELAYRLFKVPAPHFSSPPYAAEWKQTYGVDPETAIIFAPLSELEALRAAIARHIWREMQDARTREHLELLLWLLEPIAETHTEMLHVCAAKFALGVTTPIETLRAMAKAHLDNDGVVATLEIKGQIEQMAKRLSVERPKAEE
jgi:hypothetical protein